MILFCVTQLSDILVKELLFQNSRDLVTVVTDKPRIADKFKGLGIHSLLLRDRRMDISKQDKMFADLFMPGLLEGQSIEGLPLWKVLSLDRLKFWFNPSSSDNVGFLTYLNFDKVFISMDLHNVYPWTAMNIGRERGIDCVAIQTSSLKTNEWIGFKPYLSISEYLVKTKEDESYLKRIGIKETITVSGEEDGQRGAGYPERSVLRKGLGILENELVVGILFDKRDEWQCRKWLDTNIFKGRIFVFPIDTRSRELVDSVLAQYLRAIVVYSDYKMLVACDKIISFRYDEGYCLDVPSGSDVQIVDYGGLNKADMMVPQNEM